MEISLIHVVILLKPLIVLINIKCLTPLHSCILDFMTVLCVVHLHLLIIRSMILNIRSVPGESLEAMVNHILLERGEDQISHGARVGIGKGCTVALLRI